MMIVKVKYKKLTYWIPVPYSLLYTGIGILTSNFIQRKMRESLGKPDEHASIRSSHDQDFVSDSGRFGIELMLSILENQNTKQMLRQLIKEIQRYKGTVLVDVRAKDGTEVLVKL
ncbi:hypothetical protein NV379_01420 [Paenibacillus sp. N1-5-1-14]|uniref:hypothetical protein n=1 Tax=Paenibacillus radicibacter TaxID=2972488 RepID=UPI0021594691|nr:hypothetical protein [Paenibacillus radicibacter]MCR8641303.1 hypothetical protein [Paenibacillus radicibacter]